MAMITATTDKYPKGVEYEKNMLGYVDMSK